MRSILLTTLTTFALAVPPALAAPDAAHATTGCGLFSAHGAAVHAKVVRGRAACPTARAVLRRYLTSTAPCSGSACVRRQAGWVCASATVTAFPRLASCSRGGAVVAAYSTAD